MVAWPATLPQSPLLDGFEDTPPNLIIRSETDGGQAKVRRRYTAGVRPGKWSFYMTKAQCVIFNTFYEATISGGATPFDFTDPITDATESYRIVRIESPFRPVSGTLFAITLEVEQLP